MTELLFQFIGAYMNVAKGGRALKLRKRDIVLPHGGAAPSLIMVTDQLRAPRVIEATKALPPISIMPFTP